MQKKTPEVTQQQPSEPLKQANNLQESQENSVHATANFKLNQYEQNVAYKAKEMGINILKITVVLNKGCVLKSARSFIIL